MHKSIVSRLFFALAVAACITVLCPALRMTPSAFIALAQDAPLGIQQIDGGGYTSYYGGTCIGAFHTFVIEGTNPNGTIINAVSPNGLCGSPFISLPANGSKTFTTLNADDRFTSGPVPINLCLGSNGGSFCANRLSASTGFGQSNIGTPVSMTIGNSTYTISNAFFYYLQPPRVGRYYPDMRSNDGSSSGIFVNFVVQFKVTVTTVDPNVAPELGAISAPVSPVQVNNTVGTSSTFTDPNDSNSHTAVWNWGDGNSSAGNIDEAAGTVTGNNTYISPGVYTVTLTLTDSGGLSDTEVFEYIVVFDPNGGFVTGGGWITSPAGAYAADSNLTGKANFGFNSKYHNGATVPSGNTEFQFKVASLNFKGADYEWLVVAGAKAQYKGTGTINGSGNYGFMLTSIDGQINGGGGVDKFRIKIWDKSNGDTIVYDNQIGGADDDNPTTAIGGGSIVIHKQ
jgi:hypothetical protein